MKLRPLVIPVLSLLVGVLFLLNLFQFLLYRSQMSGNDRVTEHYAKAGVGNLLEIRDEMNAIKTPVTAAATEAIKGVIDKSYITQQAFEVVFFVNPTDTQVDRALIEGLSTSRGALESMNLRGDYQDFERVRSRIAALAGPFTSEFGPSFLSDFRTQVLRVPLQ